MKIRLFLLFIIASFQVYAQEDLLSVLNANSKKSKPQIVATFKSTRVINGQSVENIAKKHLDFRIAHRFGPLNSGTYEFFGLDQAAMRMSLEYGLTDDLMVGVGRSSIQKTYDYFAKYKLLKQTKGGMPFTLALMGSVAANSLKSSTIGSTISPTYYSNVERLNYVAQILLARKFNENLSLQISPTFIHRNKVFKINPNDNSELFEPNDIFAIGVGGRYKISKRTSFNAEYFYRLPSIDASKALNPAYQNALSIGFDIETGGHVFQLHFTNALGMIEKQFIAESTDSWKNGGVRFGFNISRTFSFDGTQSKRKW